MRINKDPKLSKSRFLSGRQCHLRLWYSCFNRDLASPVSPSQQAIFDAGHEVGELATRLYPEGVLIREDHLHHEEAVRTTLKAMQDPNVKSIYEAAFFYDGVRIRVDILERLDSGQWNLIEVKSSTSIKDVHLPDVAIQYYVLEGSGLDINRAFLSLINNQYVYDGNNLDLETVNPAIPRYINTRPYQIIPFQWSDHILYKDGTFEHKEYLYDNDKDPREDFVRALLDALNKTGTIFIYTTYEKGIITRLAEPFPQFRNDLLLIPKRFKDLCAIIRNNFYHPGFHGSFSLKSVLPNLVPDMDYEKLAIQEGNQASFEFLRMIDPLTTPEEKQRIKQELLEYCGYDTLAMVKIRDKLLERV